MNIHPIFVHFPIALLTLYSLMELLQFKKMREYQPWLLIKGAFLVLGTLSSFAALQTGEMAEHIAGHGKLVETHSTMAAITVWVFITLSVIYIVRIINTEFAQIKDWLWNAKYICTIWNILSRITDFIFTQWWILIILGIIGVILITIVGALGGAIVYGSTADPAVSFIYNLFF